MIERLLTADTLLDDKRRKIKADLERALARNPVATKKLFKNFLEDFYGDEFSPTSIHEALMWTEQELVEFYGPYTAKHQTATYAVAVWHALETLGGMFDIVFFTLGDERLFTMVNLLEGEEI